MIEQEDYTYELTAGEIATLITGIKETPEWEPAQKDAMVSFLVTVLSYLKSNYQPDDMPAYPYISLTDDPWQNGFDIPHGIQVAVCTRCGLVMAATNGVAPELFSGTSGLSICETCTF